jgi:transposase InsO family protein
LRQIAGEHPRWGWKTAHQILLREGWNINRKRTRRVWRQEGLRRPVKARKRKRLGTGESKRLRATTANEVWAVDFIFDETSDRRRLKICNIVDEHTREALAVRVDRSCTAEDLIAVIEDLILTRGAPKHLRADNGPEMIAWALRDYCRMNRTNTAYIEPGSPWENPFVESFNSRIRDELLNIEEFGSLTETKVIHRGLALRVQHVSATLSPQRTHTQPIRSNRENKLTNQNTPTPWTTPRDPVSY